MTIRKIKYPKNTLPSSSLLFNHSLKIDFENVVKIGNESKKKKLNEQNNKLKMKNSRNLKKNKIKQTLKNLRRTKKMKVKIINCTQNEMDIPIDDIAFESW